MESSKYKFDQNMRDSEFGKRNVGWFRVDIEALPELSYGVDQPPNQIVLHNETKTTRYLHLEPTVDLESE